MIEKLQIENLDIVITRSCQLNCSGCLVFSDHNRIKQHIDLESSIPWLTAWAEKLNPSNLFLFGGEPLMNPDFADWVKTVSKIFNRNKERPLMVQTNGIKIKSLDEQLLTELINQHFLRLVITNHNNEPWYADSVNQGIDRLYKIVKGQWTNVDDTEKRCTSSTNPSGAWFGVIDQVNRGWVTHYEGYGETLHPGRPFDSESYTDNHNWCEAKSYVQLYNGNIYKCPTMAVLKDTLEKYDYPNQDQWAPWLGYEPLTPDSDTAKIKQWFELQTQPEKYCNMCFGNGRSQRIHTLKIKEE